jgi:hypothetical protein
MSLKNWQEEIDEASQTLTCDDRFETHMHHLLATFEEKEKSILYSLESWKDLTLHNDSDHNGEYNRKHYIDHFNGMAQCIESVISSTKHHIDIYEKATKDN